MVHFFLGLPILVAVPGRLSALPDPSNLLWFPVAVLVQLVFTVGARADRVGADGALPRHPRHPRQRPDAVVLRHADHLSLVPGERPRLQAAVRHQSVHPPRGVVPGDPVLHAARSATGNGCSALGVGSVGCCSSPATGCSIGCATRSRRRCSDDAGDRALERLQGLPPLRRAAVLDAQERAAAAQHPARPAAERDVSGAHRRVVHRAEGIDLRRHRPKRLRARAPR